MIIGALLGLTCLNANALLLFGPDIIVAPGSILDDSTVNYHMQAFDEAQEVWITEDIYVDGGVNLNGLMVSSHMIFLNTGGHTFARDDATWSFDGQILGVMSDYLGAFEVASSDMLGAAGTDYPDAAFSARGMERGDSYWVSPDQLSISVSMRVTEPGDWIRVVTASPAAASHAPEPSTMILFGAGIAGLAGIAKRKKK